MSFQAAVVQASVRSKIMGAIETLPEEIEESNECLDRFRKVVDHWQNKQLIVKALDLYTSVLSAIEGMLRWLDESAFSKSCIWPY